MELPRRPLRLAFFGTPDIARVMLEHLLDAAEDEVVLVVCQPDRPRGRGKKVEPPPVKVAAEARGLPVVQPTRLKDGKLAARLRELEVDLGVVVAYGRILPRDLFLAPKHRTWNVHASLLPRHRGASPIQHAILAGDPETGVTLMELTEGLDEGPMLLTRRIPLDGSETAASLTEALARLGAEALVDGLRLAKSEGLIAEPQQDALATHADLLEKGDGRLDFARSAVELDRQVRAVTPWPGAFVPGERGEPLKILRARPLPGPRAGGGTAFTPVDVFDPGAVHATAPSLHGDVAPAPITSADPPMVGTPPELVPPVPGVPPPISRVVATADPPVPGAPGHAAPPVPGAAPPDHGPPPGIVVRTTPTLAVQTGAGWLEILEVQPPGKRPMSASDYLRGAGRHIRIGNPLVRC